MLTYTIDRIYEQTLNNVVAGIMRFLDKPEQVSLKACFTENAAWFVYQQGIDDRLFLAMDASTWLLNSPASKQFHMDVLWDEALYQVTTILCTEEE